MIGVPETLKSNINHVLKHLEIAPGFFHVDSSTEQAADNVITLNDGNLGAL